jgi:hypothetical protein
MPRFFLDTGSPRAAYLSPENYFLFSGVEKPLDSGLIPKRKKKEKKSQGIFQESYLLSSC